MEMMLNKIVPEGLPYRHSCEGPDDMVRKFQTMNFVSIANVYIIYLSHLLACTCESLLSGQFIDNPHNGW